jgi:SPIRAL1-like protein
MTPEDIDCMFRQILLKDMRTQCRLRGISPAGGKEQLAERLKENMLATKDL